MAQRKRRYCLTLNNPTSEELQAVLDMRLGNVKRCIFANEVGESGTPHLQGFIHLKNACTLQALKKRLGSNRYHVEVAHGTDYEAWTYCAKDGDIFLHHGETPEEVELSDWERILMMVENGASNLDICRAYPGQAVRCAAAIDRYRFEYKKTLAHWREMKVTYIYGRTGTGKTRGVLYDEDGNYRHDVYRVLDKKNPWCDYDGQTTVVFEEFRSQFTCRDMLNWLDGHPCQLPARYANKWAEFDEVFIISNWTFDEQYLSVQENSPETYAAFVRRITEVRTQE